MEMTLDEALDACEPCWGSVGANGYDGAQRRYQVMRRLVDGSLSLWEYDGTSTVCNLERLPEEAQRLNWQPLYPSGEPELQSGSYRFSCGAGERGVKDAGRGGDVRQ